MNVSRRLLQALVVICLVIDAIVHLRLASGYQQGQPGGIGQGNLFRIEAVVALVVALWVLLRPNLAAFVVAFLVAISAFGAVMLYRYVNVPALGPIPTMYEPVWFGQKTLSAVAEAVGAIASAIGIALTMRRSRVDAG